MAAVRFPKAEVVITKPRTEISLQNLKNYKIHLRNPDLLRTCVLPNWNRKLICDVNGRHLETFNDVITMPPMVRFTKKSKPEEIETGSTTSGFDFFGEYGFRLLLQNST